MASFVNLAQFIRQGGQASVTLSLRKLMPVSEVKQAQTDGAAVAAFEERLRELAKENWSSLTSAFERAGVTPDPDAENVEDVISRYLPEFDQRLSVLVGSEDPAVLQADIDTSANWLHIRFAAEINELRQRRLGVTHYIWRSRDDAKVRTSHAERDDRIFSWDDRLGDGHPGHGYNCRCSAEPAILDGAILLTDVTLSTRLSDRILRVQGDGLADAAADAVAGGAQSIYSALRFSWLGYRRLFGVITPEEEAERLAMRESLLRAIDAVVSLDAETVRRMADAFVEYFDARHADLRLLDLEHRLGLVTEDALLRAYRDVAYMDAATTFGAGALASAAARLGVSLARLRPREAIVAFGAAAARYDGMLAMRRATVTAYVARRFAELETQGHGPQRHEGAVTRQMLEARVLRGIDPMTGTRRDAETGRLHFQVSAASRFTTPEAFVAAESFVRRTPDYRAARETALYDPSRRGGLFEVVLPIEDVLGPDFRASVEGVVRLGSRVAPQGAASADFVAGLVVARFRVVADGEPVLVTMFPVGRRQ